MVLIEGESVMPATAAMMLFMMITAAAPVMALLVGEPETGSDGFGGSGYCGVGKGDDDVV